MTLNGVMAITCVISLSLVNLCCRKRSVAEFMQESIVFLVRVQCRRKESSRSLCHLLMSFLYKKAGTGYRCSFCCRIVIERTHASPHQEPWQEALIPNDSQQHTCCIAPYLPGEGMPRVIFWSVDVALVKHNGVGYLRNWTLYNICSC